MDKKLQCEISIVIPVYNSEKRIEKCLQSISLQSFMDFEVIVINDGSYDKSKTIIEDFCKTDNRFKIISTENRGVSRARNTGIEMSNGRYLAFVDSDDTVARNYLEVMHTIISEYNADIAMVDIEYPSRMIDKSSFDNTCLEIEQFLSGPFLSVKTGHAIGAPFGKLFRRELIIKNNLRYEENESYAEDFCFNAKAFLYARKIATSSLKLYSYYEDDNNSLSHINLSKNEYMLMRQRNTILPLIRELENMHKVGGLYTEFLAYFIVRDIVLLIQGKEKKKFRFYCKIVEDEQLLREYKNGSLYRVSSLDKSDMFYFKVYLYTTKDTIGYSVAYLLYMFLNSSIQLSSGFRTFYRRHIVT